MKLLATTKKVKITIILSALIVGLIHQITLQRECYLNSIEVNFENATLQDSNIINLNLSHDCNKQECQDFFSMKQIHFSFVI